MTVPAYRPPLPPLVERGAPLDGDERDRYSRHLLLPEIGMGGQRRLKNARVLVVGAGGLGSPVLLYLAAAGVGTLGIVDDDRVEASNLQRQIIHTADAITRLKVESARGAIEALNPCVRVELHPYRLTTDNAVELFRRYDLVIDGADNFATRYLVSDAAELAGKPCVWGSILRFGAQVSVFWAAHGPTYRDLYPDAPPPGEAPTCGEAGVLGMLCGVAGSLMAAEAVKLITGSGKSLLGRLCTFDLGDTTWRELRIRTDPARRPPQALERVVESGEAESCEVESVISDSPAAVTVAELAELLSRRSAGHASFDLVDVREPAESEIFQIPGSRSVPLGLVLREGMVEGISTDRPVILYCKAGPRARRAAAILLDAGYETVSVLEGGADEWLAH